MLTKWRELNKYEDAFHPERTIARVVDIGFIRDRLLKEILSGDYPDETRSVLLYQAGQILEMGEGEGAEALRQYLLALKLDDDLCLPVLAAGSILLGASSTQRLTRLYQVAMERSSGRTAALLALFLAEHIDEAPVEGLERLQLLGEVQKSQPDRVMGLVLEEWERLLGSEREQHLAVLDRWIGASSQPLVGAQLRLELARRRAQDGDAQAAWQLVREVQDAELDFFPRLSESIRLGLSTGDRVQTVRMVLGEALRYAGQDPPAAEAATTPFLLAEPASAAQAAALMTSIGWLLAGGDDAVLGDEVVSQRVHSILGALDGDVVMASGLDAVAVEHLLAGGHTDELDAYLEARGGEGPELDRAWNLWNRARCALAAGRFDDVRGHFAGIRELGFDSRVLDALESLGGGGAAGRQVEEAASADPLGAFMGLEARWMSGEEPEVVARALAGMDDLGSGVADLAYVVARTTGDTFLRKRALEEWIRQGGCRSDAALVDLVRLHGYERPDVGALCEVMGGIGSGSTAAMMHAVLLGVHRLVGEGRGEHVEAGVRALASRFLDVPETDPAVTGYVAFVLGTEAEVTAEPPFAMGPLEVHGLLGAAGRPDTAPAAARLLAAAIEAETPGLDPTIAGAIASTALATGLPAGDAGRLADLVLDPSHGLDAATRLHVALGLGDRARTLGVLEELAEQLEPGVARGALRLTVGMRRLFEDGDADAAIHAVGSAAADDPESREAHFALAFLAPAVDRWQDVAPALDALLGEGSAEEPYAVAMRRVRMLLSLVLERDAEQAAQHAARILQVRGGDPVSLLVQLASSRGAGDLEGYRQALARLALWFGDPRIKGNIAHHGLQLALMDPSPSAGQDLEDRLPPPDPVNLSEFVAAAVQSGPVDLTDAGVGAAMDEARSLTGEPHRARALVELGELAEQAGQARAALAAFIEALDADPMDPAAVEGTMRMAAALEDSTALARGCEARAGFAADRRRRVKLLVKAAELYAQDKATADRAADCYQRAAEVDPSDPRSFTGLVRAMELRGDVQGVIDLLERRVASTSESDEIEVLQLKLADLRRQIKDFDGALLALDDLLIMQPRKVTAWRMKLDLLLQLEKFGEALDAADQLLEYTDDPASRVAVLHKCISVSLARAKDLRRGLGYCLRLISEGEADENLVNKTMRLALRLEAWDEAAALQEELARNAGTPAKRHALLLKKAEIYLRYSKNPVEAAEVYRRILGENPVSWEALMRWNASRGAEGLSRQEVAPYIEQAHGLLEEEPLKKSTLVFLVKAYRLLREATAARYYDGILGLLAPAEGKERPQARTSMAPVVPQIPQGTLEEQERTDLLGAGGPGSFVAEVLGNLCEGGGLDVLQADGVLPEPVESAPMEAQLPLARQVLGWAEAIGARDVVLESSPGIEEGIRLVTGARVVIEAGLAHPVPDAVLYRAGTILGCIALRAPVLAMCTMQRVAEFMKAGLMAAGVEGDLDPGDGTPELAERLRASCTSGCLARLASLAEVAPSSDAAALGEGLAQLGQGLVRAGILVSASVAGMLAVERQMEIAKVGDVREFFEAEAHLREGLRFALSSRFVSLRQRLGLER